MVKGLNLADCPTLEPHDMPGGVIQPNAHCITWLQTAIDYFHIELPFASRIDTESITIPTTGNVTCPSDFILDVRDGLVLASPNGRLKRLDYQKFLSVQLAYQTGTVQFPSVYCVMGSTIKVAPLPSAQLTATLHYYALPPELGPATKPDFPSDWCLIEFVCLMAWEWVRAKPPGTAMAYARACIADLKKAGLGNEPESDTIPLDSLYFRPQGVTSDHTTWMGQTSL